MKSAEEIKQEILKLTEQYYQLVHNKSGEKFVGGKTAIPYAGRYFDEKELQSLIESSLEFWLTAGRFAKRFETEFAEYLGVRHCLLTNSGSSANLLAISALTSPKLGERQLKPGDEVISVACAFPTTVNPIIQNGLIPVFLDVNIGTYNVRADKIKEALSEKTRAIFLAHTLGNPFELNKIAKIAQEHNLWLIEDNCDALGSRYNGQYTGTFGHLATFSFYPAHHITMGEGGAIVTNDNVLKKIVCSFRDWGRDCWCDPGQDNTCKKRFKMQVGKLPFGYDHKYTYSHIGYNLKITDMQAAIGVEQLKKLPYFISARKKNWGLLYSGLEKYRNFFDLPMAAPNSDPSWFGFILTIKENAPFTKIDIVDYLESNKIATRMLFSGNILCHPNFNEIPHRVYGNLDNTNMVMKNTFWIGVYPGIDETRINYILNVFEKFMESV
ncbi:MAG: lipopolysaccharide biosynthesis protein RfbH [Candidatus Omnitrophica bacterium]|nr:lipopolysaccharide biosynthesis protein RfbH [Candidatus Omnitrophota bacterium]